MWKLNQEILKIGQSDYFTMTFDKYVQLGHTRSHKLLLGDLLKEKLEPFTPQVRSVILLCCGRHFAGMVSLHLFP